MMDEVDGKWIAGDGRAGARLAGAGLGGARLRGGIVVGVAVNEFLEGIGDEMRDGVGPIVRVLRNFREMGFQII